MSALCATSIRADQTLTERRMKHLGGRTLREAHHHAILPILILKSGSSYKKNIQREARVSKGATIVHTAR